MVRKGRCSGDFGRNRSDKMRQIKGLEEIISRSLVCTLAWPCPVTDHLSVPFINFFFISSLGRRSLFFVGRGICVQQLEHGLEGPCVHSARDWNEGKAVSVCVSYSNNGGS